MPEIVEHLRRYGEAVERVAVEAGGVGQVRPDESRLRSIRGLLVLGAAACLVVAGAVGLALAMRGQGAGLVAVDAGPDRTSTSVSPTDDRGDPGPGRLPEGWSVVTELSFEVPSGAIVAGVADAVVVVGSGATRIVHSDGTVATAGAAPLPVPAMCCGPTTGLVADGALVLVEEGSTEAWALDLESGAWRQLDDRPESGSVVGSAVMDGQLVVVSGAPASGASSTVASLDLVAGTWSVVEPLPTPIAAGDVVAAGGRMIVAGAVPGRYDSNVIGDGAPVVFERTSGGQWIEHPSPPISGRAVSVAPMADGRLVAWNYDLEAAIYDAALGEWSPISQVPMEFFECVPRSTATGSGIVAICGEAAWLDAEAVQWSAITSPADSRLVVAEDTLVALMPAGQGRTTMTSMRHRIDE